MLIRVLILLIGFLHLKSTELEIMRLEIITVLR